MWEDEVFSTLPKERQSQLEVVQSAFDSIYGDLAYLTMPVTAGRRLYKLLAKYRVKNKEELERKFPGALWNEVVLPNIEAGKKLASTIHLKQNQALIVPGIFNASALHWTQHDYMVLWLRFITSSAKEIYLAPDWEFTTGGVMEFTRAMAIQFHFAARQDPIAVKNEEAHNVDMTRAALSIAYAIRELQQEGFDATKLTNEYLFIASMAHTLLLLYEQDKSLWERHVGGAPSISCAAVTSAAFGLGIKPVNLLG